MLTGCIFETTQKALKCMQAHGTKVGWRRNCAVRLKYKKGFIIWSFKDNEGNEIPIYLIKGDVLPVKCTTGAILLLSGLKKRF